MCCRRSSEFPGAVPVDRDRPSCIAWTCDLDRCPPAGLLVAESDVRFRQALSSIDQQLATGRPRPDGRRGKLLVVGLLMTAASQAVLNLPAFAVTALRRYQQEHGHRTPLRLPLVQPGQVPGRWSWTWCCAPSATPQYVPTMPAARSGPSPTTPGSRRIRTCCAIRWPQRWRPPRSPPA